MVEQGVTVEDESDDMEEEDESEEETPPAPEPSVPCASPPTAASADPAPDPMLQQENDIHAEYQAAMHQASLVLSGRGRSTVPARAGARALHAL